MVLKEFEKFLKVSKKNEKPEDFKIQGIGGIDVFSDGEKIASIYQQVSNSRDGFKRGYVVANTDISRTRKISVQEKIAKAKEVWKYLKSFE
jgi:hypothetical protein